MSAGGSVSIVIISILLWSVTLLLHSVEFFTNVKLIQLNPMVISEYPIGIKDILRDRPPLESFGHVSIIIWISNSKFDFGHT